MVFIFYLYYNIVKMTQILHEKDEFRLHGFEIEMFLLIEMS